MHWCSTMHSLEPRTELTAANAFLPHQTHNVTQVRERDGEGHAAAIITRPFDFTMKAHWQGRLLLCSVKQTGESNEQAINQSCWRRVGVGVRLTLRAPTNCALCSVLQMLLLCSVIMKPVHLAGTLRIRTQIRHFGLADPKIS